MDTGNITQIVSAYFQEEADILYLLLNRDGTILEMNRYTVKLLGGENAATHISDVLVDFSGNFNLLEMGRDSSRDYLLNVQTFSGLPQTFVCRFFELQDDILLIGKLNVEEIERLRRELLSSNNELHNLSRELQRKNAELARLNQLKNQFLGMAAHDLRKPVSIVLSYAEFLVDEAGETLSAEHRDFLAVILSSSDFMRRIIDDFLDVSVIESGRFELDLHPGDLVAIVKENLVRHQMQARKKTVAIRIEVPEAITDILLDRSKIEQVLNNLVGNAIEHSDPEGNILVAVSLHSDTVTVSVQDEGDGIPKDEIEKLFTPFGRSSARKIGGEKSTGLGLAISRKIIEAHHGTIGVDSQPGAGATFYFSLPVGSEEMKR